MKKWLVGMICLVVLLAVACCAAAELQITVPRGATVQGDGTVECKGDYYYRLNLETDMDRFMMGWNSDITAEEPENSYVSRVEDWRTDGNGGKFVCTIPPADGGDDALFYRDSDQAEWKKIVFHYDRSRVRKANVAAILTDENPALYQDEFWVEWKAVSGNVDQYIFNWGRRGEMDPYEDSYTATENRILVTNERFGGPGRMLGKVGLYDCWVDVLKDGEKISSKNIAEFTIEPDFNAELEDDVEVTGDDEYSIKMNQWVNFTVKAPGANYVQTYLLDGKDDQLTEERQFAGGSIDYNEGDYFFQWIDPNHNEPFDKYIAVEAVYSTGEGNDETERRVQSSRVMKIHVTYDGPIEEKITYRDPSTVKDVEGQALNTKKAGRWQVARDGRLFVDVNNIDAECFGLYIAGAGENDPWLADSHWVWKSDGETTRVPLTVARCEAGKDYEVRVFAVKFGSEYKEAETTIPIHVTEASNDSPVIISMGDGFITGEPLRVFAHYTDPENIEDGALGIRIYDKNNPDNVIFDEMQGYEDFWNDEDACWIPGEYTVEAYIHRYGEVVRHYPDLKTIYVINPYGTTLTPIIDPMPTTVEAGQDLVLSVSFDQEEGHDLVMPEWVDYDLLRVDWDYNSVYNDSAEIENGSAAIVIPGEHLEAGVQYVIKARSMQMGCAYAETEFRCVAVQHGAKQILTVTVNGDEAEYREILSSTNIQVKVHFDNQPTMVRVLNGDNWEYWFGRDENYQRDWGFGDGEYLVYAEATWDDIDTVDLQENGWGDFDPNGCNWSATSNSVVVRVISPYGEMVTPRFTIANDTYVEDELVIPWGENLKINIEDEGPMGYNAGEEDGDPHVIEGSWFFMNFQVERYDENGNQWWDRVDYRDDILIQGGMNLIPTYNLEPGCLYMVEIGADAGGYSGSSEWKQFRMGERPDEEEIVKSVTVNGVPVANDDVIEIETSEQIQLGVYETNAEWYRIQIIRGEDAETDNLFDNGTGMLLHNWSANRSGTYLFTALACGHIRDEKGNIIQDEYGNDTWEDTVCEFKVHVTSRGELSRPWVDMPMIVDADEDIHLNFHLNDGNVENIGYWVSYEEEWDWLYGEQRNRAEIRREVGNNADTYDFVIPAGTLEPNRIYHIYLDADARGYDQGHSDGLIYLIDRNNPDPRSVDLSVWTEDNNGASEILVGENYPVTVNAPGAEEIYVWWACSIDFLSTQGGYFEEVFCQDWKPDEEHKDIEIYALARYGRNMLRVSNTIVLPLSNMETAEVGPKTTVTAPAEVPKGQFIEATISKAADDDVFGYAVYLMDGDDNWIEYSESDEAGTMLLPTADLEIGETYRLSGYARVRGKYINDAEAVEITITEPEDGAQLYVSKTEAEVLEPIMVSVSAPGAERIRFSGGYDNWWDENGWEGETWGSDHVSWDRCEDEDITIKAEAWYPGDEDWTEIAEEHIKVTAPNGSLARAKLNGMPERIIKGQDLFFSINPVKNAEYYEISIDDWWSYRTTGTEFLIPARVLNEGRCTIHVYAMARGYNASESSKELVIEEMKPEILTDDVADNSEDLVIRMTQVEGCWDYSMVIHAPNDEQNLYEANLTSEDADEDWNLSFRVPAGTLKDGIYWIDCFANGDGMWCENHKSIVVRNATETDDNITIVMRNNVVPINQEAEVELSAPGARAFMVCYGDRSVGCPADENGNARVGIDEYQPYQEVLYARACYDKNANLPDQEENWWEFDWESITTWGAPSKQTITVTFTSDGRAGQPSFSAPDTIAQGEMLVISDIHLGDGANEAHANINAYDPNSYREDWLLGGDNWQGWDETARAIYLPTAGLEPGEYWIAVDNGGVGRDISRGWRYLTVTEGTAQDGYTLSVPEHVQAGYTVPISVYVPGAGAVAFSIGDPESEDAYIEEGEGEIYHNLYDYHRDETGTVTVYALAKFAGDTEWQTMGSKDVEICDPLSFDLSGVPAKFELGQENAKVTIPLPANAEGMYLTVRSEWDGDGENIFETDDGPARDTLTIDIPSGCLTEGRWIHIWGNAFASGFDEMECDMHLQITVPEGEGAMVTIRKQEGDEGWEDGVWAQKDVEFNVSATDGHTLSAVRFYNGHSYWEGGEAITRDNHGDWFYEGEETAFFHETYNEDPDRLMNVFAEVLLDDSSEWISTNVLQFTVQNEGRIGWASFADDQVRDILTDVGQEITLHLAAAEEAEFFWVDVCDQEGRGWNAEQVWNEEEDPHFVTIKTDDLEYGTYRIYPRAGKEGWISAFADEYVTLNIGKPMLTVDGPRNGNGEVSLITGEAYSFQAYAPGAERIDVFFDYNYDEEAEENGWQWDNGGGDEFEGVNSYGYSGSYLMIARAWYSSDDGEYHLDTEPVTIRVNAPYGDLKPAKFRSSAYYGSSVSFTVEPDPKAEWYRINDVYLYYEGNEGANKSIYNTPYDQVETEINGWTFDNIGDAHIRIEVAQGAKGYNETTTAVWMRPFTTTGTIKLPDALTEIEDEAFMGNQAMTRVIIPDGVKRIGRNAFENCGMLWAVEIPGSVESIGSNAFIVGNITIYAPEGSAAEQYAKKNGIDFIYLE